MQHAIKMFIALVLFCAPVLGADTGIRVVTTVRTNEPGSISTKDVFTRDGQTNLVRNTRTKEGKVQIRVHRLYHDGSLVGILTSSPDTSSATSEADSHYALDLEYGRSGVLKYATIFGGEGVLLDAFACTNGVLTPVPNPELSGAADVGTDAKKLMSHARQVSPEQFRQEVDQMIEKDDK